MPGPRRLWLATLIVLLGPAGARAATPPRVNGDLAYERAGDLYAVTTGVLDGRTTTERLTRDHRANRDPAWSPFATKLAYASHRGGDTDIWVEDLVGDRRTRLTRAPGPDTGPTWAPSGRGLAFTSRRGGTSDVWATDADGTNVRPLAWGPAVERQPAFSPDGTRIAFASNRDGPFALWIMNADGSDARRLAAPAAYAADPTWSPDGTRIAFASGPARGRTGIVTVAAASGGDLRTVTPPTAGDRQPAWSPDGRQILFTRGRAVLVADAAGATAVRGRVGNAANADWAPLATGTTPEAGESVVATPTDRIRVQVPGSQTLQPLDRKVQLPVGTRVDTGDAALRITATGGTTQDTTQATLAGQFEYTQSADGETNELVLGDDLQCGAPGRATAAAARYDTGWLRITRGGSWKASGRHINGASRRTTWFMKVACDKEVIVVTEHDVTVGDPDWPTPITVAAGQCYVYPSATGRPLQGDCGVGSAPPATSTRAGTPPAPPLP